MALREKKCKHCQQYFFYDDGTNTKGEFQTDVSRQLKPRCPNCVDPHAVPGYTYKKLSLLISFRKYLSGIDLNPDSFDDDTILSMMRDFPQAISLYESDNFRTITFPIGFTFAGNKGNFRLLGFGPLGKNYRWIQCTRCNKKRVFKRNKVLMFVMGLHKKGCASCDSHFRDPNYKRNTSGLSKNGRQKSEDSERARAKVLNVSRMDLRRHGITQRVEPLPLGTLVDNLKIILAYWDEVTMTPKYRLECITCKAVFEVTQKRVNNICHPEVQCRSLLQAKKG